MITLLVRTMKMPLTSFTTTAAH